jgi:predicted membrane protein
MKMNPRAPFLGFLGGAIIGEPVPDYLVTLSTNENQVITGMYIELIWALSVIGIPIVLFPILKKHNEVLAQLFFSFRFMEALSTIAHSLIILTLLSLSHEFIVAGAPDASYFQVLGTLLLEVREWVFNIGSGLIWSLSALVLNYILYRSKLVPWWMSAWGLIGSVLSFVTYFLGFFSVHLSEWLFAPIAVQEMAFAVWLIAKGFDSSVITSFSGKTD